MDCRANCGACCIAPSISSPIPGMPGGKPAGVPCGVRESAAIGGNVRLQPGARIPLPDPTGGVDRLRPRPAAWRIYSEFGAVAGGLAVIRSVIIQHIFDPGFLGGELAVEHQQTQKHHRFSFRQRVDGLFHCSHDRAGS